MSTIWHAQYAQLALMNWQMHQQQRLAAWQANLHQVLHETEQMAHRVANTLPKDVFAAAVHARSWLARIHGLDASAFHTFEAKRSWAAAVGVLDGAARAARNDGATQQGVDGYFARMDRLTGYQRHMGGDPQRYLASVKFRHSPARAGTAFYGIGAICVFSSLVFFGTEGGAGVAMTALLFAAAAIAVAVLKVRAAREAEARELGDAHRFVDEYHRFLSDPGGGLWLDGVWKQHPLLFEMPVPDGPTSQPGSSQTYVERKVVERQIVVVRCKYCKQLTPVDNSTCEHCGAAGFGSAQ